MQQKHEISSAIPACGVALSLASFGAAESPATQPERVDQKQVAAVQAKEPLGHTFFQFTDIDFRNIMNVPIYSPSITDSVVSAAPATKMEAAVKSGLSSTTSHSSEQSEPGGGLVLAAVAPLVGAGKGSERKRNVLLGRCCSGGGVWWRSYERSSVPSHILQQRVTLGRLLRRVAGAGVFASAQNDR